MKIVQIIILLIIFISSFSEKFCNYSIHPKNPIDCQIKLSEEEIRKKIKYCCYVIIDDNITCKGLTQEEYEEIQANVLTAEYNYFYYRIECSSIYYNFNLIFYFFIFFFFVIKSN